MSFFVLNEKKLKTFTKDKKSGNRKYFLSKKLEFSDAERNASAWQVGQVDCNDFVTATIKKAVLKFVNCESRQSTQKPCQKQHFCINDRPLT